MSVVIFIVILIVLVLVHEFGHFALAKWTGMRVDEFGIGFPPRLWAIKKGETEYSVNALPFGGFVRIYGEDGEAMGPCAFSAASSMAQALTLVAGIAMNLLLAYVLLVAALFMGTPRALSDSEVARARDLSIAVSQVLPNSPAQNADVKLGDLITSARDARGTWTPAQDPATFSDFINASRGASVTLFINRNGTKLAIEATPETGTVPNAPTRYALGVAIAPVGIVPVPFGRAVTEGASLYLGVIVETFWGFVHFFAGVFTLNADLSQVAGPVGIAKAVGAASIEGLGNVLSFAALISINLALLNLIPVPALDGGRLLFVAIESVTRRPIKSSVAQMLNSIGFALLVMLMIVVTFHDIFVK